MYNKSQDTILKEVCIRYFYSIILVSSLFAVYYIYENIEPLNYFVSLCPIAHIFLFFIPYSLDYKSIKILIPYYLVYLSFFLYANMVYFWTFGQITAFMWYSIIPIAAMIFFSRKTVALWGIYVLVLICSVFVVGSFIPKEYFHSPTEKQLMVINIMTIVLSISFILFFIYYLNKINLIREIHLAERESVDETDNYIEEEELESDKLDKLYLNILNYFVEKEPFCDPDYTITQLAKELQSNVKYISRIIKIKEDVNFSTFLNKYRIKLIKELIAKDYHNKYTIRYIYSSAGFRHQSTFNKVFKELEGITPSEYIKNNKGRNQV